MRRRTMIQMTGGLFAGLALACGSSDNGGSAGGAGSCDGVGSTSSVVNGHSHFVCVPSADIQADPASAQYVTSEGAGHTHEVILTHEQLASLAAAGTVEVTSSATGGHTHTFTLSG